MKKKLNIPKKKLLIGVVCIIVALLLPVCFNNDFYITIFCQALLYAMVALGLNFITGMTGMMNLGMAGIYALGAYTSALLTTKLGISPWLAIPCVLLMGSIIGKVLGYPSLRVSFVYLSLTTIAFCEIIRLLLMNLNFTGGTTGVRNIPPYNLFGWEIDTPKENFYFLFVVLLILILIAWRLVKSKWGRVFNAVRDNVDAVPICGIDVADIKIKAFTLSAVFGCIAGALYAHFMGYINPATFTQELTITFVVILILGGLGNMWGCIFGAFVVAVLPEVLRPLDIYYRTVYALIMMLLIIFVPGGLLTIFKKRIRTKKDGNDLLDQKGE